jgi:uncharacterized repeat protein (TIGR01451 family)
MSRRPIAAGLVAVALCAPAGVAARPGSSSTPGPSQRADLTVNIAPPPGVYVGQPGTYQVTVANVGRREASGVELVLTLPRTSTSPQVFVLGTLGTHDGRCALGGTHLECALGTLSRGATTTVAFTIALPQSSAALVVGASVTSASAEATTSNNSDSDTAYLLHPLVPVAAGETAHVDHCTGTDLTSFFECELFPSSISSHELQFLAGGVIAFIGAPASSYHGTWDQTAGDDRLRLDYYDGTTHEATFDGWAVGPDRCFEGVTQFYPPSGYVAPYRVCMP